jgi:hypothetical protein
VVDDLPGEAGFVSASDGGIYDSDDHTVTWDIGTVAAHYGDDIQVSGRADSVLLPWSTLSNTCTASCDGAEDRQFTSFVDVCGANGNPAVKATVHVEARSSTRRCAGGLPALVACADIETTVESGAVDVFPVFVDLNEYLGLEYGLMWPGQYSCAFTSCSDLTIGTIRYPGDGVSHAWQTCQLGSVGVAGWAWIYEAAPAEICLVDHPQGYAISVRDCSPNGHLDHPEHLFCAGIAGAEGENPCGYPTKAEPTTWARSRPCSSRARSRPLTVFPGVHNILVLWTQYSC